MVPPVPSDTGCTLWCILWGVLKTACLELYGVHWRLTVPKLCVDTQPGVSVRGLVGLAAGPGDEPLVCCCVPVFTPSPASARAPDARALL